MPVENFNFTYIIDSVDIQAGTILINYIPNDSNLSPVFLNCLLLTKDYKTILDDNQNLVYNSEDEVPLIEHVKHTVDVNNPIDVWSKQSKLLNNAVMLQNLSGNVIITREENTYNFTSPSGNTFSVTDFMYKCNF